MLNKIMKTGSMKLFAGGLFLVLALSLIQPVKAEEKFKATDDVFWTLELELAEGKEDVFESLIAEMVASTSKEKGAKTYEIYRNGNIVYFVDRYETNEDAAIHLNNFSTKFADRFFEIFKPLSLTVFGPASGEVRKGLEGLGAKFHNQVNGFNR